MRTVSQCRANETVTTTNKPDTNPPLEQLSIINDKEDNPSYTNDQEELHGLNNEGTDTKSSCIHVPQGPLSSQLPTRPPQNDKIKSDEHQQPIAPITPIQVSESIQHQASPENTGIHKRKQHLFATSETVEGRNLLVLLLNQNKLTFSITWNYIVLLLVKAHQCPA